MNSIIVYTLPAIIVLAYFIYNCKYYPSIWKIVSKLDFWTQVAYVNSTLLAYSSSYFFFEFLFAGEWVKSLRFLGVILFSGIINYYCLTSSTKNMIYSDLKNKGLVK